MIGPAPKFMDSEYYDPKNMRIKDGAPEEIKREYEKCFNRGRSEEILRVSYPEFKHPFRNWKNEIVERNGDNE